MIPVMLLISCFSIMILKTNGYVGSKLPLRLFFFVSAFHYLQQLRERKNKTKKNVSWSPKQFFFPLPFLFQRNPTGGITFLITYSDSYSKRFRGPQSLHCWGVSLSLLCSSLTALLKQGATRPQPSLLKDVDWLLQPCHLSVSRPTNVYNQNQYQWASRPAQKCAF